MLQTQFKQCHPGNYSAGRNAGIQYIVIHYTANDGDTAYNNVQYFASTQTGTSAHYFVDENDVIWQSVADEDTAWHCGAASYRHPYCRNNNSIGVEMCSRKNASGDYYFYQDTIAHAAELTLFLMNKYQIPLDHVIRHFDVTGKICPAPMVNEEQQWQEFRAELVPSSGNQNEIRWQTIDEMPGWAQPTIRKLMDNGWLNQLDLSLDMVRTFVVNDVAGLYDRPSLP